MHTAKLEYGGGGGTRPSRRQERAQGPTIRPQLTPRPPRRLRKDASRGLTDLLISLSMAKGSRPERGDGDPSDNVEGR